MKILPVETDGRTDRRTDTSQLTVGFRNLRPRLKVIT